MSLQDAVEPVVTEAGLFLEDVRVTPAGKRTQVKVVVDLPDGPGGVTSDQLATVTRAVSSFLDTSEEAPKGQYVLEVTTPGATRQLTTDRHFDRAQGRIVIVTLADEKVRGRLMSAEPGKITLNVSGNDIEIARDDIVDAHMDVEL